MRHLFVTQDYAPDRGGMARRHVELCRRFAPDAMAVSTVRAAEAERFDRGEGYEIAREPFTFAEAKRLPNRVRWARHVAARVRRGIDVLHCGNIRPAGYAVWWAARATGRPYLLYVYGGDLMFERRKAAAGWHKRVVSRRVMGEAAAIIAISDWTARLAHDVMAELGIDRPPPVEVTPLGTDPAHFHPSRDTGRLRERLGLEGKRLMLTVARLVPHKGQDVAIRALAEVRRTVPHAHYLVVGDGPDAERLRALAGELGVADGVTFAGALSDDEIAEAYAAADLYVGLSREVAGLFAEGFGISFVEAAASGTPSVAGNSGGVSAAVRDGETGLLVPPADIGAAARAIRSILDDPARAAAIGRAGRRAVEEYYNWDRVARDTVAIAHRVAEAHAAARART